MKSLIKREEGQSIVIITFAIIALLALVALAVDAGNTYIKRRQVQNAFDAASQAGTVSFAMGKKAGEIQSAVLQAASNNGGVTISPSNIWVVLQDSQGNRFYYQNPPGTNYAVGNFGGGNTIPVTLTMNSVVYPVVGIHAEGNFEFDTLFAQIVGFQHMSTGGSSSTLAKCGACSSRDLFPILVDAATFSNGGNPAVITEQTTPNYRYVLRENQLNVNQNRFRYVYWAQGNSIDSELNNGSQATSGTFFHNDTLTGKNSISASTDSNIVTALQNLVNNNTLITIPVADTGTNTNTTYSINGFARLHITCYKFGSNRAGTCTQNHPNGDDKYIEATVQNWTTPSAGGGCANYGVCAITDTSTTRKAIVTASYNKILKTTNPQYGHVPVDVALVLDISSSMNDTLSGGSSKLTEAKTQLKSFIAAMKSSKKTNPTWTDQVSLVTFPQIPMQYYSKSYTSDCNTRQTKNEQAQLREDLGGSLGWMDQISTTIGGLSVSQNTPTAAAVKLARLTLLGSSHISGNTPVMIILTDGRANVRVDTGYYAGDNLDAATCNYNSVQDMTNEATIAKSNGIIVFVVAIGTDWSTNPNLVSMFPAMASYNTNNTQHFIPAPDHDSLVNAWTSISTSVQQIGTDCQTAPSTQPAVNIPITLKREGDNTILQQSTDAAGQAIFTNIPTGIWDIQPTSVTDGALTYNQYTLGPGGMNLVTLPTLEVKIQDQTYPADVWLSSTTPVTCSP